MKKWFVEDRVPGAHIGYRAVVDENGYVVCEPSPMGEANARLIAAAPDLLAALERCVEQIQQMRGMFDDSDGTIQAALEDAQKAIDMVTGGTA